MTIKKRCIMFVSDKPFRFSANTIARILGYKASSVSSALCKAAKAGEVSRRRADGKPDGAWLYGPKRKDIEPWEYAFIGLLALTILSVGILSIYLGIK
jgi:predicted transcriptional regulator